MAKDANFVTELTTDFSPDIWRRGYLHRKIDEDANDNISSFHDVKTADKADFDRSSIWVHSDLHYTNWDHSYGTEFGQLSVLPSDNTFLTEAWTSTSTGTGAASIINGVLKFKCPTSSTIYYTKTNPFDTISATTGDSLGSFTFEFEYRKGTDEGGNDNPFKVLLKCGTFHVLVTCNLNTITFEEVGGSSTSYSMQTSDTTWASQEDEDPTDDGVETGGAVEYGGTYKIRIMINKKNTLRKAQMIVNDTISNAFILNHTVTNTSANSITVGYTSAPTSRSFSYIGYMRYHNVAFYPKEVYRSSGISSINNLGPAASKFFTLTTGAITSSNRNILSGTKTRTYTRIINTSDGTVITGSAVSYSLGVSAATNGGSIEFRMKLDTTGSGTGVTFNVYDGTYVNTMVFTNAGTISFNTFGLGAISCNSYHTYRIVQKAGTSYLYVDNVLIYTLASSLSATAASSTFTFNGASVRLDLEYIRTCCRAAHPTRTSNQVYIAIGDDVQDNTFYYRSYVTDNTLLDDISSELSSCYVLQKDLSWGECGFDKDILMYYRGSNSSFAVGDASPSYTAVTASDGLSHRDVYTEYKTRYFQTKCVITKNTQELTFMRYHRQVCLSDMVTSWGTSTFDRDVNTRRIDSGDLRVRLMNGDGEFDTYRTYPEKWNNAAWETWIGVTVSSTDYVYPDFVGTLSDMVFDFGVPYVTFEVSNSIKDFKELEIGRQFQYPPYTKQKVFYGGACYKVQTRGASSNSDNGAFTFTFYLDSKYNIDSIDNIYISDRLVWSNGALIDAENYTAINVNTNSPCSVSITPTTSGTPPDDRPINTPGDVTVDLTPQVPKNQTNPSVVLKDILQVEGNLLLNYDIDESSFDTFESDASGIAVYNIEIDQIKLFDFVEKFATQVAATVSISSDTQNSIVIEQFGKYRNTFYSVAFKNIDEEIPGMSDMRQRNPIENSITLVDLKYDVEKNQKFYTYVNDLTVGEYDQAATNASTKVIDIFGVRTPSKRFSSKQITNESIPTEYNYITDIDNIATVSARNFAIYGMRPPIYELLGCHPDIFLYSFRDVIYLYGETSSDLTDTIEITRIEKDYDNLTGVVHGISNRYFQYPGGVTINRSYAVADSVCLVSNLYPIDPTEDPSGPIACDTTGQTVDDDYWLASDTDSDPNVSYATT